MSPKVAIAIVSCGAAPYRAKVQSQRETWIPLVDGADVRVFMGRGAIAEHPDEIVLDCDDGYAGLPQKVRLAFAWALENGYDLCFKCDDDTYVCPERLMRHMPVRHHWCGRLRGPSGNWRHPYTSGFGYWLSATAMRHRVHDAQPEDVAEDRVTGTIMAAAGIRCHNDHRYIVASSRRNVPSGYDEGPRRGNDIIASCEYGPQDMLRVHHEYLHAISERPSAKLLRGTPFDEVDVLVKTFLRDGLLERCVASLREHLPGARIVVVDDGYDSRPKTRLYHELRRQGHAVQWMSFDSGFGAKSNEAKLHYERPFVLVFSDDFQMTPESAKGVERMLSVLRHDPHIGSAGGRVDARAYEADIVEAVRPDGLKDVRLIPPASELQQAPPIPSEPSEPTVYRLCHQTVNYNLVRTEALADATWDEKWKIGGDHLYFYQQILAAGWKVAWVHGADIHQMEPRMGDVTEGYGSARGRARLALPDLYDRLGWATFQGIDGPVETRADVQRWYNTHVADFANLRTVTGNRLNRSAIRRMAKADRLKRKAELREALRNRISPLTGKPVLVPKR